MDRILYVDDDPDIRLIAVMSLELDGGFEVRACASGAEALVVADDWRPHLILLDVMMPDMDGPQTLQGLRASPFSCGIPVVFITARVQAREVEQLVALGARGVIAKPFDPLELPTLVRGYLNGERAEAS